MSRIVELFHFLCFNYLEGLDMLKKLTSFFLLGFFLVVSHQSHAQLPYWAKLYDYDHWPGKDGTVKTNLELTIEPFLGYGFYIMKNYNFHDFSQICLHLPHYRDIEWPNGTILIQVFPTIEEAQFCLCYTPSGFSGSKPERLLNPPVGDVAFGLDQYEYRNLFFSRANVMVSFMNMDNNDTTKVIEKLPAIIDAAIQNAPIWKTGDTKPRLKISDEFIKTFPLPPR
jgi:hypothetical protein